MREGFRVVYANVYPTPTPARTYLTSVKAIDKVDHVSTQLSYGITVDVDAPVATTVELPSAALCSAADDAGVRSCSVPAQLLPRWASFNDTESGIQWHTVAVGTSPYGAQASDASGGDRQSVAAKLHLEDVADDGYLALPASLELNAGQVYYATVVATSGAGRTVSAVSVPFRVDTTAPYQGTVQLVAPDGNVARARPRKVGGVQEVDSSATLYTTEAAGVFNCTWDGFDDTQSPLAAVNVALREMAADGTAGDVVVQATAATATPAGLHQFTVTQGQLASGSRYQCHVTVTNVVGEATSGASSPVMVEGSPPVAGEVYDGITYLQDADAQGSNMSFAASWSTFVDAETGVDGYMVCAGLSSGSCDLVAWHSVGLATTWSVSVNTSSSGSTSLLKTVPSGSTVYVSVRATNGAALSTTATSDGISITTDAPLVAPSATWLLLPAVSTPSRATCGCTTSGAHFSDIIGACFCGSDKVYDAATNACASPSDAAFHTAAATSADGGVKANELKRLEVTLGPLGVRVNASHEAFTSVPCTGQQSHLVLDNQACVCPAGSYRLSSTTSGGAVTPCTPCPPHTFKRVPGDSPALCRPCWFSAEQRGVQLQWTRAAGDPSAARVSKAEFSFGTGTKGGAQWHTGDLGAANASALALSGNTAVYDTYSTYGQVPFRQGSTAVAHVTVTGDNGARAKTVSVSTPVLDAIPPSTGWVADGAGAGSVRVQASTTELHCTWGDFEETAAGGITAYDVAFGTAPGKADVREFTAVPRLNGGTTGPFLANARATGLSLSHNVRYYATVRAWNSAHGYAEASSSGVLVDGTAPSLEAVWVVPSSQQYRSGVHSAWIAQGSSVSAGWALPVEAESELLLVEWAIGVPGNVSSVRPFERLLVSATGATAASQQQLPLSLPERTPDGSAAAQYVVAVRLTNSVGRTSTTTSPVFGIDSMAPVNGTVVVPAAPEDDGVGGVTSWSSLPHAAAQAVAPEGPLFVHWSWAAGPSGIGTSCVLTLGSVAQGAQVALGEASDDDNEVVTRHVDCSEGGVKLTGLALRHGTRYTVSVQATSGAGVAAVAVSPAVLVDTTPPVPAAAPLVLKDTIVVAGIAYASRHDSALTAGVAALSVQWQAWADDLSGMAGYSLAIHEHASAAATNSTTMQSCNACDDATQLSHTFPDASIVNLTAGTAYVVTLRGSNGAGASTDLRSQKLVFDESPPIVSNVLVGDDDVLEAGQHRSYQQSSSHVHAAWSVAEPEAPLARVEWAVFEANADDGKPTDSGAAMEYTELPAGALCASVSTLKLKHDTAYVVLVRATNVLGLVSVVASSPVFVVDTTPPLPGRVYVGADWLSLPVSALQVAPRAPLATGCACSVHGAVLDTATSTCSCGPGLYFETSTGTCELCADGFFKASPGDSPTLCTACGVGATSLADRTGCACADAALVHHTGALSSGCTCAAGFTASLAGHTVNSTAGVALNATELPVTLRDGSDSVAPTCTACPPWSAKAWVGTGPCLGCPSGAVPTEAGAAQCACSDPLAVFVAPAGAPSAPPGDSLGACHCKAGAAYNAFLKVCVPCGAGTFKDSVGNEACRKCPARTSVTQDASSCVCREGLSFDTEKAACVAPALVPCGAVAEVCTAGDLLERAQNWTDDRIVKGINAADGTATQCKRCFACSATPPYVGAGLPIPLRWNGFRDAQSGVSTAGFAVALGTSPWGRQLSPLSPVPASAVTVTGSKGGYGAALAQIAVPAAAMAHSSGVYATVSYASNAGWVRNTTQLVARVDATPPLAGSVGVVAGLRSQAVGGKPVWRVGLTSDEGITLELSGIADPEGGISKLSWFVTPTPSAAAVTNSATEAGPFATTPSSPSDSVLRFVLPRAEVPSAMASGSTTYYVVASVVNVGGLTTCVVSEGKG